jgi:hypothetical protein
MVQSSRLFKRAAAVANPGPDCYGFPGDIFIHSAPARMSAATAERNPLNLFNAAVAGHPADPTAAALVPAGGIARSIDRKEKPVFEKTQTPALQRPPSKDSILKQADGLRDLARRARRLAEQMSMESDQRRLVRYVEELEESASRLEKTAVEAKAG